MSTVAVRSGSTAVGRLRHRDGWSRHALHGLLGLVLVGAMAGCQPGDLFTVAGNGLDRPYGDGGPASVTMATVTALAETPAGDVLVAEGSAVRRVDHATGIITTIIGSRVPGDSGDGGAATSARLTNIRGLAVTPAGDVYVADAGADRIRRVDHVSGVVSAVAGTGSEGYGGDGGPATAAVLHDPQQLALDAAGNLYVADQGNNRVRRIETDGTIETYVGDGTAGAVPASGTRLAIALPSPSGVAFDASGLLYVSSDRTVVEVTSGGQTTAVPVPSACSATVVDLAVGTDGSLYAQVGAMSETGNFYGGNVIRLSADLQTCSVVNDHETSGSSVYTAQYRQRDYGLVARSNATLVFGLSTSKTALSYNLTTHALSTFIGASPAASNTDSNPVDALDSAVGTVYDMAAAPDGGTYLVSSVGGPHWQLRVRYVGTDGVLHNLPWQPSTNPNYRIRTIAVGPDGAVYGSDGSRIWRYADRTSPGTLIAGALGRAEGGDGGPATAAGVNVTSLAVDADSNVYLAGNYSIRRIDAATGVITHVAGTGSRPSVLYAEGATAATTAIDAGDLAVASDGDLLVLDRIAPQDEWGDIVPASRIVRIDSATGAMSTFAGGCHTGGAGVLGGPATDACISAWRYEPGSLMSLPIDKTGALAVASDGTVYISEPDKGILRVTPDGVISHIVLWSASPHSDVDPLGQHGFADYGPLATRGAAGLWAADVPRMRVREVFDPRHAPAL